jgi:hypothetical protein
LTEAVLAEVELLSLVDFIGEYRAANFVRGIQHVLKLIEMIGIVDELMLISIHSCLDFDGNRVPQIALRVDITFATIAAVSNHDQTPLNRGGKRLCGSEVNPTP